MIAENSISLSDGKTMSWIEPSCHHRAFRPGDIILWSEYDEVPAELRNREDVEDLNKKSSIAESVEAF